MERGYLEWVSVAGDAFVQTRRLAEVVLLLLLFSRPTVLRPATSDALPVSGYHSHGASNECVGPESNHK